jgi:hypothetical protein
LVPRGRLKVVQDCVAAYFQPSPFDKLRAGSTGLNLEMEFAHALQATGRHHYHLALLQISQVLHKVSSNSRKRRYALPQAAILKSVSILSGEGLDCGTGELPLFSLYAP